MAVDLIAFYVLIAASIASVIWYFRARREMIRFLKEYTDELEKELKPVDKEYMLLGYL